MNRLPTTSDRSRTPQFHNENVGQVVYLSNMTYHDVLAGSWFLSRSSDSYLFSSVRRKLGVIGRSLLWCGLIQRYPSVECALP